MNVKKYSENGTNLKKRKLWTSERQKTRLNEGDMLRETFCKTCW